MMQPMPDWYDDWKTNPEWDEIPDERDDEDERYHRNIDEGYDEHWLD